MTTLQAKFYVCNFFVLGNFFRELADKLSKRAMMKLVSVKIGNGVNRPNGKSVARGKHDTGQHLETDGSFCDSHLSG